MVAVPFKMKSVSYLLVLHFLKHISLLLLIKFTGVA